MRASEQVGRGFNQDYWERLERMCRKVTRHVTPALAASQSLYTHFLQPFNNCPLQELDA
jgi:DNA/RNA endonuclease G (NUC1)